jgi:hypothetical protein
MGSGYPPDPPQWSTQPGWPPPESPRRSRSWLGFGIAAGAIAFAAGAFFIGRATTSKATASDLSPTQANVAAATTPGATTTGPGTAACVGPDDHHAVAGTLKSNDKSKLTVTDKKNQSVTVNTTPQTKVTKIVDGKVSDVTNSAVVTVKGTAGANSTIAADQIAILPSGTTPPAGKFRGRVGSAMQQVGVAVGTVSNANNGTFTVTEPDGTKVTVTTSSSTKVAKATSATVGDLSVDKPIVAEGTANADGSITANSIQQNTSTVLPGTGKLGPGFGFGFGKRGPGGPFGHSESGESGETPGGSTTTPPSTSGGSA